MPSEREEPHFEEARTAYKARVLTNALGEEPKVGPRSAAILSRHQLLRLTPIEGENLERQVLDPIRDREHPNRVIGSEGPLVFIQQSDSPHTATGIIVRELLLSPSPSARSCAIEFIKQLGQRSGILMPRTIAILEQGAAEIASGSDDVWQQRAIQLYDALEEDFLFTVATLRQALLMEFGDEVQANFRRVLRPTPAVGELVAGLLVAELPSFARAEEIVLKIVGESRSLAELCERYVASHGHVPYAGPLSFPETVEAWVRAKGTVPPEDVWHEVWQWATNEGSANATMHACVLFTHRPAAIPPGAERAFASRLLECLVGIRSAGEKSALTLELEIQTSLARHYFCYFATRFPGGNEQRLAATAAWLSRIVGNAIAQGRYSLAEVLEQTVKPAAERSFFEWYISRPLLTDRSRLRWPLLLGESIWGLSLACELHQVLPVILPVLSEAERLHLQEYLWRCLVRGTPSSEMGPPEFLLERTIMLTVERWIDRMDDRTLAEQMRAFLKIHCELGQVSKLREALENLPTMGESEQAFLANLFRMLVYTDDRSHPEVGGLMDTEPWRAAVLEKCSLPTVDLVLDGMVEIASRTQADEAARVPHYIVDTLEKVGNSEGRAQLLFGGAVIACIATGKFSAMDRLLSTRGAHMRSIVEPWRARLESVVRRGAPWVAGRARPVAMRLS